MRASLRSSTWNLHQKIEAVWTLDGGFKGRDSYLGFLANLAVAHRALGIPAALAMGDADAYTEETKRVEALAEDLGVPAWPKPPLAEMSPSYGWGVAYVLNGSTLGASSMLKQGHIQDGWPSAYMRLGRTYVTSGKLKAFFEALNTAALDQAEVNRGALDTFAVFENTVPAPAKVA